MGLMLSEPKWEMFSLLALDTQWSLFTQLSSHQTEADTAGAQRGFAGRMGGWVAGEWRAGEQTVGLSAERGLGGAIDWMPPLQNSRAEIPTPKVMV